MALAKCIFLGLVVSMCLMLGSSHRVLQDSNVRFPQEYAEDTGDKNDDGGRYSIPSRTREDNLPCCGGRKSPYDEERTPLPGHDQSVNMDGNQVLQADSEPYSAYDIGVSKEEQLHHGKHAHLVNKLYSSYAIKYSKKEHFDEVAIIAGGHEKQDYHPSVGVLPSPYDNYAVNEPASPFEVVNGDLMA